MKRPKEVKGEGHISTNRKFRTLKIFILKFGVHDSSWICAKFGYNMFSGASLRKCKVLPNYCDFFLSCPG